MELERDLESTSLFGNVEETKPFAEGGIAEGNVPGG